MRISDWSSDVCSSDLQKPFRDLIRDQERSLELGRLRAEGYDEEAAALERALQLQDDIGKIGAEQYQQIIDNERAQLRVNDALEARRDRKRTRLNSSH